MKKNIPILTRYLWWPLQSVANWIGSFNNRITNKILPWSMKVREVKKRRRANPDAKGASHSDTHIFNHPRR